VLVAFRFLKVSINFLYIKLTDEVSSDVGGQGNEMCFIVSHFVSSI